MNTLAVKKTSLNVFFSFLLLLIFAGIGSIIIVIEPQMALLAAFVLVVSIAVILIDPFLILLLLIALASLNSLQIITSKFPALSLTKVLFLPLFFVVVWNIGVNKKQVNFKPVMIYLILFIASATCATIMSEFKITAISFLRKYYSLFLLYFLIVQMTDTLKKLMAVLVTMLISCTLSAMIGLGGVFWGISTAKYAMNPETERLVGLSILDPNTTASMLLVAFFIGSILMIESKKTWAKILFGISSCIILLGIVFTFSRGISLAILSGIAIMGWNYRKKISILKVAGIGFLLFLLVLPFIPTNYWARMNSLSALFTDEVMDVSMRRRYSYHAIGAKLIAHYPLFGIGPGNYPRYHEMDEHRYLTDTYIGGKVNHNTFLSIWVENGIFGMLTFMLLIIFSLKALSDRINPKNAENLQPEYRAVPRIIFVASATYFVSCFFLHGDFTKYLWVLLALAPTVSSFYAPNTFIKPSLNQSQQKTGLAA
ncbi:MAG: hypothetical protein GF398_01875 [Chitinivibrionales bacterium]|nr:hypothetical protein [Chitinivibrionales bacterium]